MSILKIKRNEDTVKISCLGLQLYKRKTKQNEKKISICGLPIYSKKIRNGKIKRRVLFVRYSKKQQNFDKLHVQNQYLNLFSERESIDSLFEKLRQFDIVSFDIFDTALFRKVEFPNDVFDMMSLEMGWTDFTDVRKKAEDEARVNKQRTEGHREIKLGEIYDILEVKYGISRKWQKMECELEKKLSLPNPFIYELYSKLIDAGVTVIFCSDMYLPYETLIEMLEINGYTGYEKLYLSNEYNLRKGDGKFQKKILTDYAGKRIAHVGDNEASDKKKSDQAGMTGIWNPDSRFNHREGSVSNLSDSLYWAIVCNTTNNGTWNHGLHYTHGFRVGGILAAGYCRFINNIVEKDKIEKILFCGRDCYIVEKIYNKLFSKTESAYAETSRYAVMNLSPERYSYDLLYRFVFRYWDENKNSKTVAQILEDMGYDFLVERLEEYDIEKFQFCGSVNKKRFENFFLNQVPILSERAHEAQNAAAAYYGELIGNAKRILISDIGWSGTCITALRYFLHKHVNSDLQISGALLFSSDSVKTCNNHLSGNIHVFGASPAQNVDLLRKMFPTGKKDVRSRDYLHMPLEYLFTSTDSSLAGYSLEDGKPILVRDSNTPNNPHEILEMQEGMMHFCKIYQDYLNSYTIKPFISPYTAFSPLLDTLDDRLYCHSVYKNFLYDACTAPKSKNRRGELFESFFPDVPQKELELPEGERILFVTPELTYTGSPRSLLRVCRVAQKQGYVPIVWSLKEGPFRVEYEKEHIPVLVIKEKDLKKNKTIKVIHSCKMAYCNTIVTDDYVRFISKFIPTIWFIREATNIPDFCRDKKARLSLLQTFSRTYCVSKYAADAINSFTKAPVHVITNCVEDEVNLATNYIAGSGDKVRFVQFGTMEYRKGYDVLLAAYKAMPEDYRNRSELYFAGGFINSATSFCSYLFSEMKGIEGVHYLGIVQGEENKIRTLSEMDVIVVASRDESCSLVALEGAMLSKPLIVTENVGAKYMVEPENGFIAKTADVESLKQALMAMIDHKEHLADMGKVSRRLYEERASMTKQENDLALLFNSLDKADEKFRVNNSQSQRDSVQRFISSRPIEFIRNKLHKILQCYRLRGKEQMVIISMTSYPGRMSTIVPCVKSLIAQTWQNKKILLWLSEEQFPKREQDLPKALTRLCKHACFEIRWVKDDLKPHKKYFYAMQEFRDLPLITVDDDVIYHPNMVAILMDSHRQNPHTIVCHRANLIMFREDGSFRPYDTWRLNYRMLKETPTFTLLPTGVGGVLYPPYALPDIAFNKDVIRETCLYCDDLWLKMMTSLNGYPAILPNDAQEPKLIDGSQENGLWHQNLDNSNNDTSLDKILAYMHVHIVETQDILVNMRKGHFC